MIQDSFVCCSFTVLVFSVPKEKKKPYFLIKEKKAVASSPVDIQMDDAIYDQDDFGILPDSGDRISLSTNQQKPEGKIREKEQKTVASSALDIEIDDAIYDEDDYGLFQEYNEVDYCDTDVKENSKIVLKENICFLKEIQKAKVHRWTGTLTVNGGASKEALISYLGADVSDNVKRLWQKCSIAKLLVPVNDNRLSTIGFCNDLGEIYIIQEGGQMTDLYLHLISKYNDYTRGKNLDYRNQALSCTRHIVNGMEFLFSKQLSHPGLCAKRVYVTSNNMCKLYDFCLTKDAALCLSAFYQEESDTKWTWDYVLPSYGDYDEASDVWFIGMTMWEIFFGGLESLRKVVNLSETDMDEKIRGFQNFEHWPIKTINIIKSCLRESGESRPSISEVKQVLSSNALKDLKKINEPTYSKRPVHLPRLSHVFLKHQTSTQP